MISTVSDFFSSFEKYTSSTCVDPHPSVPTLQYSNATVNQQQNMYFYLFANLCFQIFECCSRCVSEMANFCSSTLESFATTVSSYLYFTIHGILFLRTATSLEQSLQLCDYYTENLTVLTWNIYEYSHAAIVYNHVIMLCFAATSVISKGVIHSVTLAKQ